MSDQVTNEVSTVETEANEKRTRTSKREFLTAVKNALYTDADGDEQINHQQVADALGIEKSSVQTRLSTLRNEMGLNLPKGKQGGAAKTDEQKQAEAQAIFTEIFGDEVDSE